MSYKFHAFFISSSPHVTVGSQISIMTSHLLQLIINFFFKYDIKSLSNTDKCAFIFSSILTLKFNLYYTCAFSFLLQSLKQLAEYLVNGNLPHFLTQQNLIEKLNENQCNNWSNHLKHVIKSWESDPQNIVNFLEG